MRRLRHDLVLIGRVAAEPLPPTVRERLAQPLAELARIAAEFLQGIGEAFARREPPPSLDALNGAMGQVLAEIEAVKGEERLIALRFAFEQLQRNLKDLTRRAQEFARAGVPAPEDPEP